MTVPSILLNRPTLLLYLTLELCFSLLYHFYYFPRANALRPTVEEYRDYPSESYGTGCGSGGKNKNPNPRHKLMVRILDRIERNCRSAGKPVVPALNDFLWDWFHRCSSGSSGGSGSSHADGGKGGGDGDGGGGDGGDAAAADSITGGSTSATSLSSSSSSSSCRSSTSTSTSSPTDRPPLRRGDTDTFFSWAFFGKSHSDLLGWEMTELDLIYGILEGHGLHFAPGRTEGIRPMRLTLDDVRATYRPLVVYVFFALLSWFGRLYLRYSGFRRHRSKSGLTYWFRDEFIPSPSSSSSASVLAPPGRRSTRTPPTTEEEKDEAQRRLRYLPLLFFHGIAPGGLTLYLPMILWGFGRDGRAVMLFENDPISFSQCFDAVHEVECVSGVLEAMDRHLLGGGGGGGGGGGYGYGSDSSKNGGGGGGPGTIPGVTLLGHSFGSCQLTWMLRSDEVCQAVRQVVLMDPVSILLSEPDVVTNFLYGRRESLVSVFRAVRPILLFPIFYLSDLLCPQSGNAATAGVGAQKTSPSLSSSSSFFRRSPSFGLTKQPPIERGKYNKIWMVQSELFIEHYLRRNFAWYNSELWLEDIPDHVKVVVCVSGNDEILNARKVRREVVSQRDALAAKRGHSSAAAACNNLELIYWPEGGHAYSVPRPETWKQIGTTMRQQEVMILKETAARFGASSSSSLVVNID